MAPSLPLSRHACVLRACLFAMLAACASNAGSPSATTDPATDADPTLSGSTSSAVSSNNTTGPSTATTPSTDANATTPAAGNGNAANANTPSVPATIKPIAWPYIGFVNNPGGNDAKAVALSFDDGPDGIGTVQWGKASPSNMSYMLDQLDSLKLKATFFLCGNKWTNALTDTQAQADIQRMIKSGHAFGSHTMTHLDLVANTARNIAAKNTPLTPAQVQAEFSQNENTFADPRLLGPSRLPFTMYRAPYGYPFQDGIVYPPNANSIVDDVAGIAPYTPYNAVHVGWGIDTKDWDCAQNNKDVSCILTNLNAFLNKGASGVILMHTVYKLSGDALPQVVQAIYDHNYHIVQVEDIIKAKYGVTSDVITRSNAATTFDAQTISDAAVAAAKTSKWYIGINEN